MFLKVDLFGIHRQSAQADYIRVPLSGAMQVSDLFLYIKHSHPELTVSKNTHLITINDQVSRLDMPLKADDTIALIPLIGGG